MTDQIEVWRKEFEQLTGATRHPTDGGYYSNELESMWQGFVMAKRAQPVILLPKPEVCFAASQGGHGSFAYVQLEPLIEAIEKAGINWISENPYPAKGE